MKICIYCKQEKEESEFNDEHVIPQSFGRFKDNQVLKCVCEACNTYFGNELDRIVARESIEGFQRVYFGIRPKNVRPSDRIETRFGEGPYKGALVQLVPSDEENVYLIDPMLQVSLFDKREGRARYFKPKDVPSKEELEAHFDLISKNAIGIFFKSESEKNQLLDLLASRGVRYSSMEEVSIPPPPEGGVMTATRVVLDSKIMRGLSKIAFNYMAYHTNPPFVLSEQFDEIRSFIRYGDHEEKRDKFVLPNQPSILADDLLLKKLRINGVFTQAHIIAWERDGDAVIARLSMFNRHTYRIVLCENYRRVIFDLKSCHLFDPERHTIEPVAGVSKSFVRRILGGLRG